MNLSNIPIIDSHAHPFDPLKEEDDFRVYFNMSLWRPPISIIKDTIINRKMIRELAKVIGLESKMDQEEIVRIRNKIYKKNPRAYIEKLFNSTNIETMLLDVGYPGKEDAGYVINLDEFKNIVPCKVYPIFRIDEIIFDIFQDLESTFEEATNKMIRDIEKVIKDDNVIALKSTIAYKTGLDMKKWSKEEACDAFNRYKKNKTRIDEKIIRDFFTIIGMKKCIEYDIPMQFHTGLGSAPELDLYLANPILLQNILADEELIKTKVVIVHAGYPFSTEAGYLVSVYPNLYCDFSAINPYFGIALKKAILNILEFCPADRIMFGSDGVIVPETYWMGYTQGVKILGDALDELVANDWITVAEAIEFGEKILYKNAKDIYKLN